ncbi:uncharacterized protein Ecym_3096 [Eremothecium cymbalariae DBVPG|uniref:Uncharacterized protein n=1 Tax=Eremothecium cymbalariae (strain CBS 270.75 / DBVPG 7215 / KCTC 17166 / NRRL Y-17582) TaxID=931890 RepID=G8JR36_ERECY|nr:Hypothetical protein Ecym_3096 [Eremothecium cymbalariae DBVPG\
MKKFDRIQDASEYINGELKRKGYLKESETILFHATTSGSLTSAAGASQTATAAPATAATHDSPPLMDEETTMALLTNDKLLINTFNKLLNSVSALQAQLLEQEARIKLLEHQRHHDHVKGQRARERSPLPRRTMTPPHAFSASAPTSPPPAGAARAPAAAPAWAPPRQHRPAQAQLRKQQLLVDQLRAQLKTASRGPSQPLDVTWHGPSLPSLGPATGDAPPLTDLSVCMRKLAEEHSGTVAALRKAKGLIEEANRYVYTRFVLDLAPPPAPPPARAPGRGPGEAHLPGGGDPELDELARDWHEIRTLLGGT